MKRRILSKKVMASLLTARTVLLVALLAVPLLGSASSSSPQSAEQCYRAAHEAVVYVRGYNAAGTLINTGSGFIISGDGIAVTAAHVVSASDRVTVLRGEKELTAEVLSCDTASDVALLRLPKGDYPCLTVAKTAPNPGAVVRAIGYPMKDTLIITEGIVNSASAVISGKTRMLVSCTLVNGMSGGPVLDEYGQVVGVCSGSVRTMSGIHLSVLTDALNAEITKAMEVKK